MTEHFRYDDNGMPCLLNGYFIDLKGLDEKACELIAELHRERTLYLREMDVCSENDVERLRDLYAKIEETEYKLQDAWGYVRDSSWHKHWEVAHCSCSSSDNQFAYPHHSIIADDCIVHGAL